MSDSRINDQLRQAVTARASGCCEYCRSPLKYSPDPFAIEHIIPLSLGGATQLENLALSCLGCNGYKYNKVNAIDPSSGLVAPLFHPRKQRWNEHFVWNEDCTHVMGMSPTGRATIEALRLNRINLVNLRRILFETGEHPPDLTDPDH